MISKNHVVDTDCEWELSNFFDEDVRAAAVELARTIDKELLECLTSIATTSGSSTISQSTKPLSLGDVREMIKGYELLWTPWKPTFEPSACGTRLGYTYGMALRKLDPVSAALLQPCA